MVDNFLLVFQSDPKFYLIWFMQGVTRPHRTSNVFAVMEKQFNDHVIVLGYPERTEMVINWPPYSPDFNPCDFLLGGNFNGKVYANNLKTISELKSVIQSEIEFIDEPTLESVMQHFDLHMCHCNACDGKHIELVI